MSRLRIFVLLVVVAGLLAQGTFALAQPGYAGGGRLVGGGLLQPDTPDDPGFR